MCKQGAPLVQKRGAVAGAPSTCAGCRLQSHRRRHSRDSSEAQEITIPKGFQKVHRGAERKGILHAGHILCLCESSQPSVHVRSSPSVSWHRCTLSSVLRVGTSSSPAAESASVPETESSRAALSTSGRLSGASWSELHLVTAPGM